MRRLQSSVIAGLFLATFASAVFSATEPRGTVVIGQVACFRLRVPDRGQTVQQRIDHIQDVAAKYLGGDPVQFTIRTVGQRQHIDVNGEFLVAVTPDDAHATGFKTAAQLAPLWSETLQQAFLQSNARPNPPSSPSADVPSGSQASSSSSAR
jgi:hypothetical protein